jgi:hypothetical protein
VQVLIRPEDVVLGVEGADDLGDGACVGIVRQLVGQGAFVRVMVELPAPLTAIVPLSVCECLGLMPGRRVVVRVLPAAVRILDDGGADGS